MFNGQTKTSWEFRLKNGSRIGVDKGRYDGDIDEAVKKMAHFFATADISIKSSRSGYGEIIINGKIHHFNPYGIDINMVLEKYIIEGSLPESVGAQKQTKHATN